MLTVLSPAKKLDLAPVPASVPSRTPRFAAEAAELIEILRAKSVADVAGLMKLSDSLATLNHERYATFDLSGDDPEAERKQAALVFAGDTYVGLQAALFDEADLAHAADHLRILSGLYGVLGPLDLIQPHRLEMGTRLTTGRGANLYEFWGPRIAEALNEDMGHEGVVVNLASNEYAKAIDRSALRGRVVTPVFKEIRNGQPRTIGLIAKKSRGAMARWIIKERIEDVADLCSFDADGYAWDRQASTDDALIFSR